jgi:hypothetical protein
MFVVVLLIVYWFYVLLVVVFDCSTSIIVCRYIDTGDILYSRIRTPFPVYCLLFMSG